MEMPEAFRGRIPWFKCVVRRQRQQRNKSKTVKLHKVQQNTAARAAVLNERGALGN